MEALQTESDKGPNTIPGHVLAYTWLPFLVAFILALIFSTVHVVRYRSKLLHERSAPATVTAVLALMVTLLTSALVPIDVFLVSYMKFRNGTFKSWASDEASRQAIEGSILAGYYAFYGLILTLAFLVLPFMLFYHISGEEDDDLDGSIDLQSRSRFGQKIWRAVKYTLASIAIFAVLIVVGIFIPYGDTPTPPHTLFSDRMESAWDELKLKKGQNVVVFLMNVLNVIGMIWLMVYTGYGMSTLPLRLFIGKRTVHTDRQNVRHEIQDIEEQIRIIKSRQEEGSGNPGLTTFDMEHLERLEQQVRLLRRSEHDLEQSSRSLWNRVILCCRPFQVGLGLLFGAFGLLIFVSLLMTLIDKAVNGTGPGYLLVNGTLPNPMDIVLVLAQDIFPLDYMIYGTMVVFFIFCTMSGLRNIGVNLLCLTAYKIRPGKTKPEGLMIMCIIVIFILLAVNVLLYSIVPDYTTYGSQHFAVMVNRTLVIEKCNDLEAPLHDCQMTRIAHLLLAFHANSWIFGAIYFWFGWLLLVAIVGGFFLALYKAKRYRLVDDDEDSDEAELLDDTNPFHVNT